MTVSALITRNDITATASQTSFTYTFRVLEATDMAVYQNGVLLSSGYTVNGVNNTTGGTVVLDVGASAGQIVSLVLAMPLDRTTNYQNSGKFLADDVNEDFDKIYIGAIQNENLNDRSLRLKDVEPPTTGVDMTIPLKSQRLGKYLAFNSVTGAPEAVAGTGGSVTDASLVNYTPAGTGAVVTTVQNKLRESVSVKDFGAVGDGTTDDTAAIQAAIDSLATIGGEVFFPSGRYSITGINVLTNSITLTGTGKAAPFNANVGVSSMLASVLVYASATGNAVTLGQTGASSQSCSVVNLSIWGNTTGYLLSVTGNHLLFDQLFLEQEGTGGGLYLSDAYQITARDIVARGVNVTPKKSSVGIWFDTTSNGTWSGGGSFKFERCNVSFFNTGYRMGSDFDGSITAYGGSVSLCMEVCQAYTCGVGFHTSYLISQIDYNSCRAEECDTHGYLIDNSCAGATIRGGMILHTGTVNIKESVRIGNDSGTAGTDKASHVLIDNVTFGNINNATIPYINVMGDSNVIDVTIQNCGFWKYLGYGVMLSGTVPTQVNIINNNFGMFSGRAILNQVQCVNAAGSDFRYEARFIDNFIETSGLKESEIQTVSVTPLNLNNAVGEFLINTSGASAIINLPASPNIGDTLKVIKKFGANTATITPQGGATIVGFNAANAVLTNAGDSAEIQYVQSGRWVIQ